MLNTKQLGRTCKATIVGVSLSLMVAGYHPMAEARQPDAVAVVQPDKAVSNSALFRAIESRDVEQVRSAIAAGTDVNAKRHGTTALESAAWDGQTETVRVLLENGAKVNADSGGALRGAAGNGHTETVRLLLENGAKDASSGGTALMEAAYDGRKEARLISFRPLFPLLRNYHRAYNGRTEIAKLLLENGAKVNAKNGSGATALMIAAHEGQTEMARLLLKKGADAIAKDNTYGWTALMFAADEGQTETAKLLLGKGSDVDAKDEHGETALMIAASKGYTETVKLLLEKGADVDAKNEHGETAFGNATRMDHPDIAALLRAKMAK